jgi:hypothetical protein
MDMKMNNSRENEFKTEIVRVDSLKPHPRNYKSHPADQLLQIKSSISQHGLYRNIVTAQDGTILAGHGVWQAVVEMGWETIPIIRLNILADSPAAFKVMVGDNEINHLAETDDRNLTEILKQINETDENGLLGTGYDEMMLANLLFVTRPESEIHDFNEAAQWVGLPAYGESVKPLQINISFRNNADREEFARRTGLVFTKQGEYVNWSAWWPPHEK